MLVSGLEEALEQPPSWLEPESEKPESWLLMLCQVGDSWAGSSCSIIEARGASTSSLGLCALAFPPILWETADLPPLLSVLSPHCASSV